MEKNKQNSILDVVYGQVWMPKKLIIKKTKQTKKKTPPHSMYIFPPHSNHNKITNMVLVKS